MNRAAGRQHLTGRRVGRAAATGPVVIVVEPGTPAGFTGVPAARPALLGRGLTALVPCPTRRASGRRANSETGIGAGP